jgi:hypothetical protein
MRTGERPAPKLERARTHVPFLRTQFARFQQRGQRERLQRGPGRRKHAGSEPQRVSGEQAACPDIHQQRGAVRGLNPCVNLRVNLRVEPWREALRRFRPRRYKGGGQGRDGITA